MEGHYKYKTNDEGLSNSSVSILSESDSCSVTPVDVGNMDHRHYIPQRIKV